MSSSLARLESRWIKAYGVTMHARVSVDPVPPGSMPVVLVHGMVVSSRYLAPLAERLGAYFPV